MIFTFYFHVGRPLAPEDFIGEMKIAAFTEPHSVSGAVL